MSKSQTKSKIVLSEENPETENVEVEEECSDYLFRFGKYKHMLCSQIVSIETANPKTKDKQKQG